MDIVRFIFNGDYRYIKRNQFRFNLMKKFTASAKDLEKQKANFDRVKNFPRDKHYELREYKFLKRTDITRKIYEDFSMRGVWNMITSHYVALIDPIYRRSLRREKYIKYEAKYRRLKKKYGDRPNMFQQFKLDRAKHKSIKYNFKSGNVLTKRDIIWFAAQKVRLQEEWVKGLAENNYTNKEFDNALDKFNENQRYLNDMAIKNFIKGPEWYSEINKIISIEGFENPEYYNNFNSAYVYNFKAPKLRFEKDGLFKRKMVVDDPLMDPENPSFKPYWIRRRNTLNNASDKVLDQITQLVERDAYDTYDTIRYIHSKRYEAQYDSIGGYFKRMEDALKADLKDDNIVNNVMNKALNQGEAIFNIRSYMQSVGDYQREYNVFNKLINDKSISEDKLYNPETMRSLLVRNGVKNTDFLDKTSSFVENYSHFIVGFEPKDRADLSLRSRELKSYIKDYSTDNMELVNEGLGKSYESLSFTNKKDMVTPETSKVVQQEDVSKLRNLDSIGYIPVKENIKESDENEFEP